LREDEIVYKCTPIKYKDELGISHLYYPDFFIPKAKLVVEIKSKWTLKNDKHFSSKESAVKQSGFNFIVSIDNNFDSFDYVLRETCNGSNN